MIKIEHLCTYGWEAATRGMRNPMNSWDKGDNGGANDAELMKKLVAAGTDHSKFMRQIGISMDITAPLYWWKEFDTYKVGTVANSCSTMHKIMEKEFEIDDFSHEHIHQLPIKELFNARQLLFSTVDALNYFRLRYLESKDKIYWWRVIQLLPSSYNQKRTVTMNYAVARNMYQARNNHKLDEWREFCDILERRLPMPHLLTMTTKKEDAE